MKRLFTIIPLLVIIASSALAATYYVNGSTGSNANTGTSEAQAWRNIGYANNAVSNETIMVAPGVYDNSIGEGFPLPMGNSNAFFSTITGAATIEPPISDTDPYVVDMSNAMMEGFTVIYRSGSNCLNISSTAEVRDNFFLNTFASGTGVKIASGVTGVTLEGNTITANNGISDSGTDTRITGNKIFGYDSNASRGIFLNGSGYCTVSFNEIRGFTGTAASAVYFGAGNITLDKNTIVKNHAGIDTSPSYNLTPVVKNSIFAAEIGGYSATGTKGILNSGTGSITSEYNCFFANDTDYAGTVSSKEGDIYSNPQFMDASGNDYNLEYFSPCIDTGDPATSENDADGTRADMGAYYYNHALTTTTTIFGTTTTTITGTTTTTTIPTTTTTTAGTTSTTLPSGLSGFSRVSSVLRPGATLNIDFLADISTSYKLFIFYQSTGAPVQQIDFDTKLGPNRVSWEPSGDPKVLRINTGEEAPPGVYYYEIRSLDGTRNSWGNFVIGKWNQ